MGTEFHTLGQEHANWHPPDEARPEQNLESLFQIGQKVSYERNVRDEKGKRTGQTYLDGGWEIGNIDAAEQKATVLKAEKGKPLVVRVALADLARMNPDINQSPEKTTPETKSPTTH